FSYPRTFSAVITACDSRSEDAKISGNAFEQDDTRKPTAANREAYDHQDSIGGGEMNSNRSKMLIAFRIGAIICCAVFIMDSARAQTPNRTADRGRRPGFRSAFPWPLGPAASALIPAAGPSLPLIGGGTLGRLPKWTGFTFSNSVIGDSTIFEDKLGNVGLR